MTDQDGELRSSTVRIPSPLLILAAAIAVWGGVEWWRHQNARDRRERLLEDLTAKQSTPTQRLLSGEQWAEKGSAALPELIRALEHANPAVREGAAFGLSRLGPDARGAISKLVDNLDDESASVRESTLHALVAIGENPDEFSPRIIDRLGDDNLRVRQVAYRYLREFGAPDVESIRRMAAHPLPDARRRAVELLGVYSYDDDASIEAIRSRLTDEDPEVRHAAFRMLADHHTLSTDELVRGLGDSQPDTVQLVLKELQRFAGDAEPAVPQLVKLLRQDAAVNRSAALDILQFLGPRARAATSSLLELAKTKPDDRYDYRDEAAIALIEIGIDVETLTPLVRELALSQSRYYRCREMLRRFQRRHPEAARPIVQELIDRLPTADDREWGSILHAVRDLGPLMASAAPTLIDALDDESRERRRSAAWALGAMGSTAREATPKLIELLEQGSSNQPEVLYALGEIGADAKPAIPAIRETLERARAGSDDDDYAVGTIRAMAVFALGRIGAGDPSIIEIVLQATTDTSRQVRRCAVSALADSGCDAERAVPSLQARLRDEDEWVQAAAARTLGEFLSEAERIVPLLIGVLSDAEGTQNKAVCLAAAEGLGRIGRDARGAVPALIDLVNRLPQRVRIYAFEGPYLADAEWVSVQAAVLDALVQIDPGSAASISSPSTLQRD